MFRKLSAATLRLAITHSLFFAAAATTGFGVGCSSSESDGSSAGGTGNVNSASGGSTSAVGVGGGGTGATPGSGGSTSGSSQTAKTVILDDSVGRFGVVLSTDGSYTSMAGSLKNKAIPQNIIWTVAAESGECKLLKPTTPFCDPACTGTDVCGASNTCETAPTALGAGTLTVKGVKTEAGATQFTVEPINDTAYSVGESLAYPPFAPGAAVSVSAPGATFPAFTVEAKGIEPLVTSMTAVPFAKDKATTLTWTASTSGANIHVDVDISHHGGNRGMIMCDAADDGSLEISAALVTALINYGTAGYPTVNLSRQGKGSTTVAQGRVDLMINSDLTLDATVEGVTSCKTATDCPTGQTCTAALFCQ